MVRFLVASALALTVSFSASAQDVAGSWSGWGRRQG